MQVTVCISEKKVNKKGFTLVELLVCIAILAVIALTLAEFVASSSKAYRRASGITKIQESCQDTLNQVSNIVRNSTSLTITKEAYADTGKNKITMVSKGYKIDGVSKTILLVYVPSNNKDDDYGKIYVDYDYVVPEVKEGEEKVYPDITVKAKDERYNTYLLTDMVKEFKVDLATYTATNDKGNTYTKVQERTVDISITLERNEKIYTQTYKASLRNSSPEGQTTELTIQVNDKNQVNPTPDAEPNDGTGENNDPDLDDEQDGNDE